MDLGPLEALRVGPMCWFRDWPNRDIPRASAGVYTVWDRQGLFLYVGMAGRALATESATTTRTRGLFSRLASHANGRRSGDQFCIYVADRLVLPRLTARQILEIGEGRLQLDALVRALIVEHVGYRFVVVKDKQTAHRLEREIQDGALGARPLLNPRSGHESGPGRDR